MRLKRWNPLNDQEETFFHVAFVMVLVLILFGIVVRSVWANIRGTYFTRDQDLKTVPGVILSSDITQKGRYGFTYHYQIDYEYTVEGKQYISDQVTFGVFGFDSPEEAQVYVTRYPAGSDVTVFYDPNDTAFSVLDPSIKDTGFPFLVCLLMTFPLLMWLAVFIRKNSKSPGKYFYHN